MYPGAEHSTYNLLVNSWYRLRQRNQDNSELLAIAVSRDLSWDASLGAGSRRTDTHIFPRCAVESLTRIYELLV